jgi:hypothetical protein
MDDSENLENIENIVKLFNIRSLVNFETFDKVDAFIKYMSQNLKNIIISKNIENFFFIIPIIDYVNQNTNIVMSMLFIICLCYSCIILHIFYYMILIDSFILSFIILQDNPHKKNSRRLAKNVISLFISSNSCSIFNILLTFFLYFEISKPVSRFILKIIKIITMLLANYVPFLNKIYPTCKNLSFDDIKSSVSD